jgi:dipeptidyl-peptidase 4
MPKDTAATRLERALRLTPAHHAALVSRTHVTVLHSDEMSFRYVVRGPKGPEAVEIDLGSLTRTAVELPQPSPAEGLASPDGRWSAYVVDGNLWVRGPDGERRLTHDADQHISYALPTDVVRVPLAVRRFGMQDTPQVVWSPDSAWLLTHRLDATDVPLSHLVHRDEAGRPTLHSYHYAVPGDPLTSWQPLLVHPATGEVRPVGDAVGVTFLTPLHAQRVWWGKRSDRVLWVTEGRGARSLTLHCHDVVAGTSREVLTESSDRHLDLQPVYGGTPQLRLLEDRGEVLWSSERTGWRHLERRSLATGELLGQVTSGDWLVRDVLAVDEQAGTVVVAAGGRCRYPYALQLLRVTLSGEVTPLTSDELDHQAVVLADGSVVDSVSGFGRLPRTVLRDRDGNERVVLEEADASPLIATGYRFPEHVTALAADGVTELHGILYLPSDFDPAKRYAVVDSVYPGPQGARQLRALMGGAAFDPLLLDVAGTAPALAELGFVVLVLDGRGTPLRSRAFLDHSFGNLAAAGGLEDHVAVIRQLAATRPFMDLDRVGIIGHSGGGYAAARALLDHGELYSVGVAAAGNHDQRTYHAAWGETYQGLRHEGDWEATSNATRAHKLEGRLLLVHGELDDNVHPQHTLALAEAIIGAGKDVDLLLVPGAGHSWLGADAWVVRKQWEFLQRHLGAPDS